jgi:Ras-related protein Rab-1A
MYYKDVSGVLLCFDLTDEETFKNINFWLGDLNKHAPRKLVKILVGNKADLCLNAQGTNAGNDETKESFENKREVNYDLAQ